MSKTWAIEIKYDGFRKTPYHTEAETEWKALIKIVFGVGRSKGWSVADCRLKASDIYNRELYRVVEQGFDYPRPVTKPTTPTAGPLSPLAQGPESETPMVDFEEPDPRLRERDSFFDQVEDT